MVEHFKLHSLFQWVVYGRLPTCAVEHNVFSCNYISGKLSAVLMVLGLLLLFGGFGCMIYGYVTNKQELDMREDEM